MPPDPLAPALLLLAAGRSSRYGRPKQLDPVGPGGATLMDYAIADAVQAGVVGVVVVASAENRSAITSHLAARWPDTVAVRTVQQDADDLPEGAGDDTRRAALERRPLGTTHAVWVARGLLRRAPFLVANADDYYGPEAYHRLTAYLAEGFLATDPDARETVGRWALAGYRLSDTLSPHGGVNRGICRVDTNGRLLGVEEGMGLSERDGRVMGRTAAGVSLELEGSRVASMNLWAFTPDALVQIEEILEDFVTSGGIESDGECLLPTVVENAVRTGSATVAVLPVPGPYFGLTHPQDRPAVVEALRRRGPPVLQHSTHSAKE